MLNKRDTESLPEENQVVGQNRKDKTINVVIIAGYISAVLIALFISFGGAIVVCLIVVYAHEKIGERSPAVEWVSVAFAILLVCFGIYVFVKDSLELFRDVPDYLKKLTDTLGHTAEFVYPKIKSWVLEIMAPII